MRTLEILKCLADLTRARIIHLLVLRGPELCVCDIVLTLGLPQSTVSRQLTMLRHLNLVRDRRQGTWMHYSIAPLASRGHKLAIELVRNGFDDAPLFIEDLRKFDALKNRGRVVRCPDGTACPPKSNGRRAALARSSR